MNRLNTIEGFAAIREQLYLCYFWVEFLTCLKNLSSVRMGEDYRIPEETRQKFFNHILNYPARSSHHNRNANIRKKYLPWKLGVKTMQQFFFKTSRMWQRFIRFLFQIGLLESNLNVKFGNPRPGSIIIFLLFSLSLS